MLYHRSKKKEVSSSAVLSQGNCSSSYYDPVQVCRLKSWTDVCHSFLHNALSPLLSFLLSHGKKFIPKIKSEKCIYPLAPMFFNERSQTSMASPHTLTCMPPPPHPLSGFITIILLASTKKNKNIYTREQNSFVSSSPLELAR